MHYSVRLRTLRIVRAVLDFEGDRTSPESAFEAILQAVNEGLTETEWTCRAAAAMDRRFASALFRTAVADIYAAARCDEIQAASHIIIDTQACPHKEHGKWDHVIVSTRLGLTAPFDWFCGCSVQPLHLGHGILRPQDTAPAEQAILARAMNTDGWMKASPERFFRLAESPFLLMQT